MGNKQNEKVIKTLNKDKNEIESKSNEYKVKRVSLELHKTDIYFLKIDVPEEKDPKIENKKAIEMAWNIINGLIKNIDPEKFRIGDAFMNKILRKEIITETKH